jgi:protein required for attachment to host cells
MTTTWIVSADRGRARIFAQTDPQQPLEEIEDMVNTAARIRTSEQYTDRLGPTSAGQSIHNTGGALPNKQYEPQQTMDEREAESFAKDISAFLLKAHQDGRYQKLDLIAEPKFLGVLRMVLDNQVKPLVELELNKDYTHFNGHQLREHLQAQKAKQP